MSRRAALVFTLALALALALARREDAICPNDQAICDCACFEKAEHVEDPSSTDYVATRCEDAEACPFFRLTCEFDLSGGPTSCIAVSDPAALACALDALARRTPGRLRWATESGALGVTDLHIAGDGTAFRVERNSTCTAPTRTPLATASKTLLTSGRVPPRRPSASAPSACGRRSPAHPRSCVSPRSCTAHSTILRC